MSKNLSDNELILLYFGNPEKFESRKFFHLGLTLKKYSPKFSYIFPTTFPMEEKIFSENKKNYIKLLMKFL